MSQAKAITVDEMIQRLKKYDGNRILVVLLDGKDELRPIYNEDFETYEAGEVFFPNCDVENSNEPGLRISII